MPSVCFGVKTQTEVIKMTDAITSETYFKTTSEVSVNACFKKEPVCLFKFLYNRPAELQI